VSVRDPTRGRPGSAFYPAVEGLRAVAALLVLLVHVSFVAGLTTAAGATGDYTARAEVGVGVFFVLSGFLLYRPWVVAHLDGEPGPPLGRFLVRRVLRILPLYWAALAVTLLLVPAARPKDALDAVLLPLLGQVYRAQSVYLGVPQAWSLCVEIVFYLALPAYAWLIARAARSTRSRERTEWAGVVLLYLGGIAARWLFEATSPVPWKVWHGFLPVWFDLFALGFALAVLSVRWSRAGGAPRFLQGPGVLGCWLAAVGVYVVLSRGLDLGRNPLYERSAGQAVAEEVLWGMFAVLLVLPAVAGTPRLLTLRPFALLGLVSYGIYLWHQVVVESLLAHTGWDLFRTPFTLLLPTVVLLTVLLAGVSYRLVERRGIALGHRFSAPLQDSRERLAGISRGR
jgi:peptidoglycan/LPS O-acetylase OafA/YrhL